MTKPALTTAGVRAAWGGRCLCGGATRFTFWSGDSIMMDPRCHGALAAMDVIMKKYNYRPTLPDIGGCVCRAITGGTLLSLHAFCATDINWQANPYFSYPAPRAGHCDMPVGMTNEICALRTKSGAPVWGWGGNYTSIKDYMHFENVCTPADLASGIIGSLGEKWSKAQQEVWVAWAIKQSQLKPFIGQHSLRRSAHFVREVQKALGIPGTGIYDANTIAHVKAFQAFMKMPVTGNMNRKTWAKLIFVFVAKGHI